MGNFPIRVVSMVKSWNSLALIWQASFHSRPNTRIVRWNAPREHNGSVHAALSFTLPIIHPTAPSTSQPPSSPGSITDGIPCLAFDENGNLAESFAIYDRTKRAGSSAHLLRFIREQDEQRYLLLPRQ